MDEDQLLDDYHTFYEDVLFGMESRGFLVNGLRCCRNSAQHLRGSVFIQFASNEDNDDDALYKSALEAFQGRWYAGRQVACRLAYLGAGWKGAVCGMCVWIYLSRCNAINHLGFH